MCAALCALAMVLVPVTKAAAFVPPDPTEFMRIPYTVGRLAQRHIAESPRGSGRYVLTCRNHVFMAFDSKYAITEGSGLDGYHGLRLDRRTGQRLPDLHLRTARCSAEAVQATEALGMTPLLMASAQPQIALSSRGHDGDPHPNSVDSGQTVGSPACLDNKGLADATVEPAKHMAVIVVPILEAKPPTETPRPASVAGSTATIPGRMPKTGGDVVPMFVLAAGLVGVGAMAAIGSRHRRRRDAHGRGDDVDHRAADRDQAVAVDLVDGVDLVEQVPGSGE